MMAYKAAYAVLSLVESYDAKIILSGYWVGTIVQT